MRNEKGQFIKGNKINVGKHKKGITLDDQQKDDLWHIRENLKDQTYIKNLLTDPPDAP